MIKKFISKDYEETLKIAYDFGKTLKKGDIIAYFGDMGAGKTAFTRGICNAFNINDSSSPTFAIVNEYHGSKDNEDYKIFHFDMYRVLDSESLYFTGFYEYLDQSEIVIIEWSENIKDEIPKEAIIINIDKLDENTREITIKGGN